MVKRYRGIKRIAMSHVLAVVVQLTRNGEFPSCYYRWFIWVGRVSFENNSNRFHASLLLPLTSKRIFNQNHRIIDSIRFSNFFNSNDTSEIISVSMCTALVWYGNWSKVSIFLSFANDAQCEYWIDKRHACGVRCIHRIARWRRQRRRRFRFPTLYSAAQHMPAT